MLAKKQQQKKAHSQGKTCIKLQAFAPEELAFLNEMVTHTKNVTRENPFPTPSLFLRKSEPCLLPHFPQEIQLGAQVPN